LADELPYVPGCMLTPPDDATVVTHLRITGATRASASRNSSWAGLKRPDSSIRRPACRRWLDHLIPLVVSPDRYSPPVSEAAPLPSLSLIVEQVATAQRRCQPARLATGSEGRKSVSGALAMMGGVAGGIQVLIVGVGFRLTLTCQSQPLPGTLGHIAPRSVRNR
jgi:hypothetical protein